MDDQTNERTDGKPTDKNKNRPRRITVDDPIVAEAAAALGRRKSPAKTAAAITNALGNKSKTGQKASEATRAKMSESQKRRHEKKAVANGATAEEGKTETGEAG